MFIFSTFQSQILTKINYDSHTVDSKIDENRCKQKYDLIQVMGDLYVPLTAVIHLPLFKNAPVSMKNSKILLLYIFETSEQLNIGVK